MGDVDAALRVEQGAGELRRRAGARRAVRHLALVVLGIGDERLEAVDRQVLAGDQHRRHVDDERHGREIGARVVERSLVDRLVLRMGADRAEHELVAVRRRLGDARAAVHAAGAAGILDHDLRAEHLRETVREDAADHVGAGAGAERHDHGDGPRRPGLCG